MALPKLNDLPELVVDHATRIQALEVQLGVYKAELDLAVAEAQRLKQRVKELRKENRRLRALLPRR